MARLECNAWYGYYRREWLRVLAAALGLVREGFGLPWPHAVWGAWLVLRGNQLWAPYPDNDPEGARLCMARFYALVVSTSHELFDVDRAARLEVEWWRVHRDLQHDVGGSDPEELTRALCRLYSHVYRLPEQAVTTAAAERAAAARFCDRWVAEGCDPKSPLLRRVRGALLRSYSSLRAAVS